MRNAVVVLIAATVLAVGCREKQAEPSQNRDLGDADRALLPTKMTFANPDVKKGSAQWLELREPSFGAVGEEPEPTEEGGEPEPEYADELREIIADYTAFLADGEFEELPGFFASSQVDALEGLTTSIPALATKLGELNAALPEPDAALGAAIESIALARLLRVQIGSIRAESDTKASAELANAPGSRLVFVLEEEEWYIEHPAVAAASSALQQPDVATLDETIAGISSGAISGDAALERVEAAKAIVARMTALPAETAIGTDDEPDDGTPQSDDDGSVGT
jgi:hypothetical protein